MFQDAAVDAFNRFQMHHLCGRTSKPRWLMKGSEKLEASWTATLIM
jgi:hypothetical protein